MKIHIVLFLSLIFNGYINAQNKKSISNGDFNNPNIWSPIGVPNLINTDSLYIEHQLTFNKKIIVNYDYFEIRNGACLNSVSGLDTISFIFTTGSMKINGSLHTGWFNNQCNLSNISGTVIAETQFNNLNSIIISPTASIKTYKWYCATGVVFEGELTCNYFLNNGGNINGTGKICVSDTLRNQGTVSGSLDICDATPNSLGDYNIGTYGPNVTFCSASPCNQVVLSCNPTGIDENFSDHAFSVYPNPSNSKIYFFPSEINSDYVIRDLTGKIVLSGNTSNGPINIEKLEYGVYILWIDNFRIARKILKGIN